MDSLDASKKVVFDTDRIGAHLAAARTWCMEHHLAPGRLLLQAEAALDRARAGCALDTDEVVLSHVLSRPDELVVPIQDRANLISNEWQSGDANVDNVPSSSHAGALEADTPDADMDADVYADMPALVALDEPVVHADLSGLPVVATAPLAGQSMILFVLVSFLSELCVLVCVLEDSVLGLHCATDTARSEAVRLADQSLRTMTKTPLHSFLLGEQPSDAPAAEGTALPSNSRVVCTPVPFAPRPSEVVRTPQQLTRARRALRGAQCAVGALLWCTLGSLVGHPLYDVATQATFTCASFLRPTADLHMAQLAGHALAPATLLRVGAGTMHSMLREPVGRPGAGCPYALLHAHEQAALSAQQFLLSFEHPDSTAQEYVRSWGAVFPKPDFSKLPKALLKRIPSFADPALATLAFSNPCPTLFLPRSGCLWVSCPLRQSLTDLIHFLPGCRD